MYNTSFNPKVIYSLDVLSDSLFKLMVDNDLNDITITELCNNTDLNRRTYYRNCKDIIDLVYYKIDKLVNELLSLIDGNVNDDRKHFNILFNYWYQHKSFLIIMKKQNLYWLFIERFKILYNTISYHFLEHVSNNINNVKKLKIYFNSFIICGVVNMLETWADNDFNDSIDDLIEIGCSLIPVH